MKPLLVRGAGAPVTLPEELVSAIHKAFEAAVEVAVQEVTKLVSQAAGDVYEDMRRENESLQQKLQRAEALLQTSRVPGQSPTVGSEERLSPEELAGAPGSAAASPENPYAADASTIELRAEMSLARLEKIEDTNQPRQQQQAQGYDSPPLPGVEWQVTVKQERPEEETPGSPSCLGSIKVEDFNSECLLATQAKMLEEWRPDVPDAQTHHSNTRLPCTGLAQAHHQNLPPAPDLPSLSSDFPSIFQLAEAAPLPDAPTQVHVGVGVHFRTGRSPGLPVLYACKSCDQTFTLPSLLRRHQGRCQQRSQSQTPGNTGTKRQLYVPSRQPFHCSVCNRAFNRMENLKTHLRIHTGERPYTCSVCSMCFRHSGALTRHFRIHTGEKPYICGQCGKSFRNCGGLRFHQRSHNKQQQQQQQQL